MAIRPADQILHKAAWLYYTHGMRQDEVAKHLDISRASVAMYLRRAREMGIVTIATSTELFSDDVLARTLEDRMGFDTVWIVPEGGHALDPAAEIPVVAAAAFQSLLNKGDSIGVAWGRTVYHIADVMPFADLKGATVIQLCGNLGAPYSYRPDQCTTEIARRLNAEGINFYAPLVMSTPELADALRHEPVIQEQMARVSQCQLVLYSVGGIEPESHLVKCGAVTADELKALERQGARGVIAGQVIDGDGQLMDCLHNRRCISASLDSIRSVPKRMMVVEEIEKFDALYAAIRGDLVTHLVVTASMAKKLLERFDKDEPKP